MQDAAAQAAGLIAEAMAYEDEPLPLTDKADAGNGGTESARSDGNDMHSTSSLSRESPWQSVASDQSNRTQPDDGAATRTRRSLLT